MGVTRSQPITSKTVNSTPRFGHRTLCAESVYTLGVKGPPKLHQSPKSPAEFYYCTSRVVPPSIENHALSPEVVVARACGVIAEEIGRTAVVSSEKPKLDEVPSTSSISWETTAISPYLFDRCCAIDVDADGIFTEIVPSSVSWLTTDCPLIGGSHTNEASVIDGVNSTIERNVSQCSHVIGGFGDRHEPIVISRIKCRRDVEPIRAHRPFRRFDVHGDGIRTWFRKPGSRC